MDVLHTLLILSGSLAFTRGQASLRVALLPNFPYLYTSDEVTLLCKRGKNLATSPVKWYHNSNILPQEGGSRLYLPMVTQKISGKYRCEENNIQSPEREVVVLNMMPHARLTPHLKKLVLLKGSGYHMELSVETGLKDWSCSFTMNGANWLQREQSEWKDTDRSVTIYTQIQSENDNSTTYWCRNNKENQRSNAITIRATGKMVMLQTVDPLYMGETLTLQCDDWEVNPDSLEEVFFYKGPTNITQDPNKDTYTIRNATDSDSGSYKCSAKRRQSRKRRAAAATTEDRMSDEYQLRVIVPPPEAHLTAGNSWLACNCKECQGNAFRWYQGDSASTRVKLVDQSEHKFFPTAEGDYSCRVEWAKQGLSRHSTIMHFKPVPEDPSANTLLVVLLVIVMLIVVLIVVVFWFRRKTGSSGKKLEDGEDGGYEAIKLKEGEYEELKGVQTQVYQTLKDGQKGTEQGEQLYEALKDQGEGKEEGAYQALKGGTQAEVYHTLKGQGESKEEGAYQALKSTQAEVYQTLQEPGGSKEEGAYEALKSTQSDVYHTLKEGGEGKKDQDEALLPKEAVPGEKVGHGEGAGQA